MIALVAIVALVSSATAEQRGSTEAPPMATSVQTAATPPSVEALFSLPHDKLDHVVYSFGITVGTTALLTGLAVSAEKKPLLPYWLRVAIGCAAGALFGLAKEGLDLLGLGHPEWQDMVADGVGVLAGAGVLLVGRF